jgi:hypothetical protein
MRVMLLLVTATILVPALLNAQAVGDPVANKVFLTSWSTPTGVDEVVDYPTVGAVVLLDWFGTF